MRKEDYYFDIDKDLIYVTVYSDDLDANDVAANSAVEDAPVVQLVKGIIEQAVHRRASDIHIEPLEQVIDNLKTLLRNNHIARLKEGSCTVETGFIWSDLITNFERVSDHCSNVAVGIIDVSEHTMNAHEVIKNLKAGNAHYSDKYEEYSSKYSVVKLA